MTANPAKDETCALELIGADVPSGSTPRLAIVEGVDWQVGYGEFWFVGGLHRSGKSDLLQLAAGLVPPLRGECRLFGHNASSRDRATKQQVGLVFDGGRLFQDLSVQENVTLPLRYHTNRCEEEAIAAVEPILELTGLGSRRHERPAALGRNWQQRAGLARALTLKPRLMLLDNPLSGLDPHDVRWWLRLLGDLSRGHDLFDDEPMTLLVSGDSFQPWRNTARRFAVLKDRRFHSLGPWPEPGSPEADRIKHMQPSGNDL